MFKYSPYSILIIHLVLNRQQYFLTVIYKKIKSLARKAV